MIKRVMLLNGPPRVGKDTVARHLLRMVHNSERIGFADHVKRATHAAYGLDRKFDAYENMKGIPSEAFFGMTPREAYIAHSETYMKVHHGPRVFGKLFMRAVNASAETTIIVPDSGFRDEALQVIEDIGVDNVMLFQLHRKGATFAGDSRSYITLADTGVRCVNIDNNGKSEKAAAEIAALWG